MAAGSHPHLSGDLEVVVRQAVRGHEPAIGGATVESRAPFPEEEAAHCGMDPIGADEDVDRRCLAVLERHFDVVAIIGKRDELMCKMQTLLWYGARQRREQVRPMDLVVGKAECLDHRIPER
jgi:hypothetical protein